MAERVLSETDEYLIFAEDGPVDETGQPVWTIKRQEWKPGTPGANEATLQDGLAQALDALRTFVGTPNGQFTTVAQLVPPVKLLCRVCIRLIRLRLRQLEGVD